MKTPILSVFRKSHPPLENFVVIIAMGLIAGLLGFVISISIHEQYLLARRIQKAKIQPIAQLETRSADFFTKAASFNNYDEDCFPIHVGYESKIGVLYQYCSEKAYEKDGNGQKLSEHFEVNDDLARRFNFWRRVYSLWSSEQYVIHVPEFPEVVLEVLDVSFLSKDLSPVRKEIAMKRVARKQRYLYRSLLRQLHANRDRDILELTPAMQRIAKSMRHISNPNKYAIAANSIRVQRGQRDFIAMGIPTATKYLLAIEKEFQQQGIPEEIALLAFVESSFNLQAKSKVGASGVYQIMPETGKQYLKVWTQIDERNDPVKASRAASKLLRLYYNMTGSWPLALTAYNHGVGSIKRAIQKTGTNDINFLIKNYRGSGFGFASQNFYCSFLGVLATLRDSKRIFPQVQHSAPFQFVEVKLSSDLNIKRISKLYNVSPQMISEMNPDISKRHIRAGGVLPRGYLLKIPAGDAVPYTYVNARFGEAI